MADLSLDENVARLVGELLRERGHDVLAPAQIQLRGARDHLHLAASARLHRTLLTHDEDDFLLLHRAWRAWFHEWPPSPIPQHGGILLFPQPPHLSSEQAAEVVDELLQRLADADRANRFVEWRPRTGWRDRE